ncbi:unnamed protein product [Fraxinus pennsylvanica]|uniref:VQ domain-containing protein n=1 Tax=Fraxinus pennsylvanica TaxID=56036 RepID=A0AAD2AH76_9LAMI|nr:unnamed protein product [Fraxinus pennsylvanica]
MQSSDNKLVRPYNQENISMPTDPKNGDLIEPVRRRSRASKKTSTTILKASTSNFRALVQQFTGCHTGAYKGPMNLNFSLTNQQVDCLVPTSKPVSVAFTEKSQTQAQQQQQQQQLQEDHKLNQQLVQEQNFNEASVSTVVSNPGPLTLDYFDMNNDVYWQELVPPPIDYSLSDNTYGDLWNWG